MRRCRYVSALGESVELDGPSTWVGTAAELRSNKWSYSIGYRGLSGVTREARKAEVDAFFRSASEADRLRKLADADVSAGTPGRIEIDEWFQRAYIVESDPGDISRRSHIETLVIVLLDGSWSRTKSKTYWPTADDPDTEWLDMPTDTPFDLMASNGVQSVTNDSHTVSPIKLTIFGPAVNPYVVIGRNRYELDATIPNGARVEIDGTSIPKTIRLIASNGDTTDLFSAGTRGSGHGSGEYVFEPLPIGYSQITWAGSFGFDLSWLEQEGAPLWDSQS